jgi:hypothetical protein
LDASKDQLRNAPGFDPDAWPDMEDVQWQTQVQSFYGTSGTVRH